MDAMHEELALGKRRALERIELDSDPTRLRANLGHLQALLDGLDKEACRRVTLALGAFVAGWQLHFAGEPIQIEVELREAGIRLRLGNAALSITQKEWNSLARPAVEDLADSWQVDPRRPGSAWFEFRARRRAAARPSLPGRAEADATCP
jgi:hypothetical protein